MNLSMAPCTKSDQILCHIITQSASLLNVMDLKILYSPARLATPAISYSYERAAHLRLERIPWIGRHLRGIFNFIWPGWEEAINWTLLVEREPFAMLVAFIFLLWIALAVRLLLGWYCKEKLGIARERLRDQILRVQRVVLGSSH